MRSYSNNVSLKLLFQAKFGGDGDGKVKIFLLQKN